MPALFESGVFANSPAWHGEGVIIDTDGEIGMTIEQALPASGLDWQVTKVPVFAYGPNTEYKDGLPVARFGEQPIRVPDRYGVQRNTDGRVFGTVGATWQPVQNIEGFQMVDDLIQLAGGEGTKAWIESAMSLDNGKKVVVMVHLDAGLQIAGEDYASYLTFVNGHDGRTSVTGMVHDERIVCSNTLAFGMGEADKSGRIMRVRHTSKATERIKEAAAILGLRNRRAEELAVQGEWLVENTMSDDEFSGFLTRLMPIREDQDGTPAATMIGNRKADVAKVYYGTGDLDPIRGTRWGALQAVLAYSDHHREFKTVDTQIKAALGMTEQPLKTNAFTILRDPQMKALVTA